MIRRGSAVLGAVFTCASLAGAQTAGTPATGTAVQARPATVMVVQKPVEVVSGSALPSNSEVWLSLNSELNSKTVKQGDKFDMTVARDVMLGNYIVIPRGSPAHGQVTMRTGKGAFGKSGKLEFDLIDTNVDGRFIPLAGHYRVEGQGNTGATVGALVAVGVFSAFVKGHSASAVQGSEWKAATKEPIIVSFGEQTKLANESSAAIVAPVEAAPKGAAPATVTKTK